MSFHMVSNKCKPSQTGRLGKVIKPQIWNSLMGKHMHDKSRKPYLRTEEEVMTKTMIVAKSNDYKQIMTPHKVNFLDFMNYVPTATSLDNLVCSNRLPECKGIFPMGCWPTLMSQTLSHWMTVLRAMTCSGIT